MSWNFFYELSAALMGAAIVVVQPQVAISQILDEQALSSMAKDVTVVINGQNPGSGVIVSRQGNTYSVLTAKHVVATPDEYEIVTADAKSHKLDYRTVKKLPGVDLAIAQFTSNQNYRVALLGDSDKVTEGATVYTSGWPHPGRAITQRIYQITQGRISGRSLQPLEDGYGLVYTNITRSGMSGGPVLDAQGRIVGIHGRAEGEPIYNPDTGDTVNVKSGFNLGIPINSFLKLASQNGINLSYLGDNFGQKPVKVLSGPNKLLFVAVSPDGQTLASSGSDGSILVWNKSTGKPIRTLKGHSGSVWFVTITPDGQSLISGSNDDTIKIWNLRTGEVLHTLTGVSYPVAISPDGQAIATGSVENVTIKIWNLHTGQLLRSLTGDQYGYRTVAFSPDGKTLVGGSLNRTITIWNLETGEQLRTLEGHSGIVSAIAISPFEPILASSSGIDGIKIWNWSTGELLHTLKGHSQNISSLAFNPSGHFLVSASYDETIKIWNLFTGKEVRTLDASNSQGYIAHVNFVGFSGDGQTLVSGGDDGEIKIWQLAKP